MDYMGQSIKKEKIGVPFEVVKILTGINGENIKDIIEPYLKPDSKILNVGAGN